MCDMEPHFFFLQCWINKSENPACPPAHRPARTEPSPHPTPPELRCTDQSVAASSIRAPRISPLSPPDTVRPFPARGTCGGVRGRIRRAPSVLNITMQRRAPQFHGLIGMRRQHPALRQSLAARTRRSTCCRRAHGHPGTARCQARDDGQQWRFRCSGMF